MNLKAPYPFFGGKERIAGEIWKRFGNVSSYVEPFFGSGAVLLGRPLPFDGVETVNDADGFICNMWRAVQYAPDEVAQWADWPVNESDLHARHAWLVGRKESLQAKLEGDPDFFDAKVAGWWLHGMACWIGSEFCSGKGPWQVQEIDGVKQLVNVGDGQGVSRQLVHLGPGRGVNRKLVHLSDAGRGVNRKRGVDDASGGDAGTGEQGLLAWMQALADRLRRVRVCCGDWTRVCGGRSGDAIGHFFAAGQTCAVFLDPPYADTADRTSAIYRVDSESVAHAVREWAIRHGDDKRLRIALAGYEGEHEMPDNWTVFKWKSKGGYSNVAEGEVKSKANCRRERIWFSPHCLSGERTLFDNFEDQA